VLLVDADRRVTPGLAEDIRRLKTSELEATAFDAFSMVRRNFFHEQPISILGASHRSCETAVSPDLSLGQRDSQGRVIEMPND